MFSVIIKNICFIWEWCFDCKYSGFSLFIHCFRYWQWLEHTASRFIYSCNSDDLSALFGILLSTPQTMSDWGKQDVLGLAFLGTRKWAVTWTKRLMRAAKCLVCLCPWKHWATVNVKIIILNTPSTICNQKGVRLRTEMGKMKETLVLTTHSLL